MPAQPQDAGGPPRGSPAQLATRQGLAALVHGSGAACSSIQSPHGLQSLQRRSNIQSLQGLQSLQRPTLLLQLHARLL